MLRRLLIQKAQHTPLFWHLTTYLPKLCAPVLIDQYNNNEKHPPGYLSTTVSRELSGIQYMNTMRAQLLGAVITPKSRHYFPHKFGSTCQPRDLKSGQNYATTGTKGLVLLSHTHKNNRQRVWQKAASPITKRTWNGSGKKRDSKNKRPRGGSEKNRCHTLPRQWDTTSVGPGMCVKPGWVVPLVHRRRRRDGSRGRTGGCQPRSQTDYQCH